MEHCNQSKLAENTREGSPGKSIPAGGEYSAQAFSRWSIRLAAGLIVLAATAAYSNSLQCPLIFDDTHDIVENVSIRHLWPIWGVFVVQSHGQAALHGRPVVNLSLAFNYATAGLKPLHYHLTNLLVHVLAGLTLFGIMRRTLLLPSLGQRFAGVATPLALAVALIWTLHPLQTGAVTYVTQRYESMMGLFYLLALYAAIRCGTSEHPGPWAVVSVTTALLALGCKEVAVSIPIVILLYDRAFLAGSFREAWRRRLWLYVGLAAAWAPFAVLLLSSSGRSSFSGYGLPVTWIEYARSQFGVILHYLRLSFWPCPLVLDYRWPVARTVGQIVPAAVVIVGLAAVTGYALIRWPKWGFLGVWFFLILAPTSSVLPILDLAFEHRMYLPLAAVVAGVVVGGYLVGQRVADRARVSRPGLQAATVLLLILAGAVLGILTFQRNADYRSDLSIWEDTVVKAPDNERVRYNLGNALANRGRADEAVAQYEKALEIRPDYAEAHNNLGSVLARRGWTDEAMAHFQQALEIDSDCADAHYDLGLALANRGRIDEAIVRFQKALELKPDYADARNDLGTALAKSGRVDEAAAEYRKALELKPDHAEAHNNLGFVLARRGRVDEALAEHQKALELKPDYAEAHNNLGIALAGRGRFDEAAAHFHKALELKPDYADARTNLDIARSDREEIVKALAGRRELLRSHPNDVAVLNDTAWVLATNPNASIRNGTEAVELAQRALELSGGREPAVFGTLAAAQAEAGRFAEAVETAQRALALASGQNNAVLADALRVRIKLYQEHSPYRESGQPSASHSDHP